MTQEGKNIAGNTDNDKDLSIIINIVSDRMPDKNKNIGPGSLLVEEAGIDSLSLMEVIEEVQKQCNVSFNPEDYSYESFTSAETIYNLVKTRKL